MSTLIKNYGTHYMDYLNIKRCYLPYEIYDECPKCGHQLYMDLSEEYLSHPKLDEEEKIDIYCTNEDCSGYDSSVKTIGVIISVNMELVE